MSAQVLAFPGCTVDPDELEDRRFVQRTAADLRTYLVARTDHPDLCDRSECDPGPDGDGYVIHRAVIAEIDKLIVAVEQIDEKDGTRSAPGIRVEGTGDFLPSDVRKLIKALWTAHDLGGGAS